MLEAYAHYNPSFGYCQGLSFVAATLIRHTAEASFGRRYAPDSLRQMALPELRALALQEGQGGESSQASLASKIDLVCHVHDRLVLRVITAADDSCL